MRVRETVPDRVVDDADEIEVVDISPEALRSRMSHGNIYPPDQAAQALDGFFRTGNLAALRELVLKRAAQEVGQQVDSYMREHALEGWEAGSGCLSCSMVQPPRRWRPRAWRLAHAFDGELIAAFLPEAGGDATHIRTVALDLNARVVELDGGDLRAELSRIVTSEHDTHVTLVADEKGVFGRLRRPSLAEWLLDRHPHLDLHLVAAK